MIYAPAGLAQHILVQLFVVCDNKRQEQIVDELMKRRRSLDLIRYRDIQVSTC